MKLFLVVYFCVSILEATCSNNQIIQAKDLYISAIDEPKQDKRIELLQKALTSCYAPEIEANLFILKAEKAHDLATKVKYYKKSLVSISKFQDKSSILKYQNEINKKLGTLHEQTSAKLSDIYHSKVMGNNDLERSNYVWVYILFGILFLWGVYKNFRR